MCTVCIAHNTRAPPGARARQRTLKHRHTYRHTRARARAHTHTHTHAHTRTHTHRSGWGGAAARDSASLRESARHASACSSAAAASPRLEPRATRSPPASARPGYLCGGRVPRLRLPPAPLPRASPPLAAAAAGTRAWVRCLGASAWAPRVPPPGTLPTASLVAVSFFALTLARCTFAPHPVPATSTPGPAATVLFCSALLLRRRQSFAQHQRCARRGECDMCQISDRHWGRVPNPTSPLVPLNFAL
jgi:hypothetical protein